MNVLTESQLKEIDKIINKHRGLMLRLSVGDMQNVDRSLLRKLRIPENAPNIIGSGYTLGHLIQTLGSTDVEKMTFKELKRQLSEINLTGTQKNAMEYAKENAAKYVTALGDRVENDINRTITNAKRDANHAVAQRQAIRDTVVRAQVARDTRSTLSSDLGHEIGDWTRDWKRVAHTEMWNAKQEGEAMAILNGESIYSGAKGEDTDVFRTPRPDACSHCKRLYLKSDGVTPKIFKLKDLMANGDNYGRKAKDYLPVVGTTHPNCFIDGKTKVFTANGYKQINQIKVGESVLTHKGRFRPVVHTLDDYKNSHVGSYSGEAIKIKYKTPIGKDCVLRVTPDHKFLTQRGWVRSDSLSEKDTLKLLMDICDGCGDYYSVFNDSQLCQSCKSKKTWEKRYSDVEELQAWKNRQKNRMLSDNPMKDSSVSKKVAEKNKENGFYKRHKDYMLKGGAVKAMAAGQTSPLQQELFDKVSMIYPDAETEFPIKIKEDKYYSLDIVIEELKINIEHDGINGHSNKAYDKLRDHYLKKEGWSVLRYQGKVPDIKTLKKDINRIKKNHSGQYKFNDHPIMSIEKYDVEGKKLFDLTVEEDHSFIAEGVVSHNCACPLDVLPEGFGFDSNGNLEFIGL